MKSGETAGQGNGHPCVPTARKRSAQARSWKPGRRRQPSGARERWKPEGGETPQAARCEARQRDRPCFLAGTPMQSWRCSVDLLWWTSSLCGIGIAAPAQPGRRCCRGAKRSAAGMCRRHFPWSASASAQRRRREVIGTRAQQKKSAPPRRAAHRMAPGAISSPSSSATARSRRVRRRRTAGRPRSAC